MLNHLFVACLTTVKKTYINNNILRNEPVRLLAEPVHQFQIYIDLLHAFCPSFLIIFFLHLKKPEMFPEASKQTVGMSFDLNNSIFKGGYVEDRKFATSAPKNMQHRIFLGLVWVAGFLRFGFALLYIFLRGVGTKPDPVLKHFKLYTLFWTLCIQSSWTLPPVTPEICLNRAVVQLRVVHTSWFHFMKKWKSVPNETKHGHSWSHDGPGMEPLISC